MKKLLVLLTAVSTSCSQPECRSAADCAAGNTCEAGACRPQADGGVAGGMAGGVAGGRAGGMAGGAAGGMAGGAAGGMAGGAAGGAATCMGCTAWQVCNAQRQPPVCEDGTLTVTSPVNGEVVGSPDGSVLLAASLRHDGGVLSVDIPVGNDFGAAGVQVPSGASVRQAAPSTAGRATFRFGWDGGPREDRIVDVSSCSAVTCAGYEACQPSVDGGACYPLPLTVTVTAPVNDPEYTNAAGLTLRVRVQSADGGPLPAAVPVSGSGAATQAVRDTTPPNADTYAASITFGSEGPKTYVVGWPDAGATLSATARVVSDATAPVVSVNVLSAPTRAPHEVDPGSSGNPWKKDEQALVAVTVTDVYSPVEPVTAAMLRAPGDGGVTAAPGQCAGCVAGAANALTSCACFRVDLAKAPVSSARAPVTVGVVGALDRAGNASALQASTPFEVTRFKWARTVGAARTPSVAAPVAIADGGLLIVPVTDAVGSAVTALTPTGLVAWEVTDAGVITAGPAVGGAVWVATRRGPQVAMSALSVGSGAAQEQRCAMSAGDFSGDLALTRAMVAGTSHETPVGMQLGSTHLFLCTPTWDSRATIPGGRPLVTARPGLNDALEFFINRDSSTDLSKYTYNGSWTGNGSILLGPLGMAPLSSLFVGATFAGGGGGGTMPANNGAVLTFVNAVGTDIISTPTKAPTANPTLDEPYGPVSVGAGHVYGGTQGGALRRFVLNGAALTGARDEVVGLGDISTTTPVLGSGGAVYVVNTAGAVSEVRFSGAPTSAPRWTFTGLFPAASSVGQPALDVVRDVTASSRCAAGLGVFYVPTVSAGVARVSAILVDAPGLDPTAPWPKHQRDNRNSGFADGTPVAACP